MKEWINRYINFLTSKNFGLVGLSIVRIGIGITTLMILISAFPIRKILWHNSIFSSFDIHMTNWQFNIFYFLVLVIFILYTLGIESVIFNVLVFLSMCSLYNLNGYITDGGNNLVIICLLYMIFTKNAQYFSIYKGKIDKLKSLSVGIHNLFFFLVLFQVCVLYFFAGFAKARGEMWYSGVAPYYIFNINSFTMTWIKPYIDFILEFPLFITLISYLSIFMQLFFPFMLLNKYTKVIGILGSLCFHIGIIFVMGLVPFGLVMIAFDLAFIKDEWYRELNVFLKRIKRNSLSKSVNKS